MICLGKNIYYCYLRVAKAATKREEIFMVDLVRLLDLL
jgi:hypothetical protein